MKSDLTVKFSIGNDVSTQKREYVALQCHVNKYLIVIREVIGIWNRNTMFKYVPKWKRIMYTQYSMWPVWLINMLKHTLNTQDEYATFSIKEDVLLLDDRPQESIKSLTNSCVPFSTIAMSVEYNVQQL